MKTKTTKKTKTTIAPKFERVVSPDYPGLVTFRLNSQTEEQFNWKPKTGRRFHESNRFFWHWQEAPEGSWYRFIGELIQEIAEKSNFKLEDGLAEDGSLRRCGQVGWVVGEPLEEGGSTITIKYEIELRQVVFEDRMLVTDCYFLFSLVEPQRKAAKKPRHKASV